MGGRALFFSVYLTVAHASAVVGAADTSHWLQVFETDSLSLDGASTFSWIPRQAPVPKALVAGDVSGIVGQRAIRGDAWRHLPPVFQAGVQVTVGPRSWWARPVLGYFHASGSGDYRGPGEFDLSFGSLGAIREYEARGQLSATIDELALGLGDNWSWHWFRLDGATGASWVRARLEDRPDLTLFRQFAQVDVSTRSDQAETIAWWSSAGLNVKFGETRIGLAARYTYAPMRVLDRSLQAGGLQLGGSVAWGW